MTENEKHLQEWVMEQERAEMALVLRNLEAEETIIKLKREFISLWLEFHHQSNISVLDRLSFLAKELYEYGEGGKYGLLQEEIEKMFWSSHLIK